MSFAPAPYFSAMPGAARPGAPACTAVWAKASDGLRIRVGLWQPEQAKGTLLILPGRTEFIEKYAEFAGDLAARGYASMAIDWRGQGLADRLLDDRRIGHVNRFLDYQLDLAAALEVAQAMDLPRPWHLHGHSMGGAIGLRAAMNGIDVQSCVFTGPMWGIHMAPALRPLGWAMAFAAPVVGLGNRLPPTTQHESMLKTQPFEGNVLTTDPTQYALMRDQIAAAPEMALGGPSLTWLREALNETRLLSRLPSPDLPCHCFVGALEKITDVPAIHNRMDKWPGGKLDVVPECEHEVLMETPATRAGVIEKMVALFDSASVAAGIQAVPA